MITNSEVIGVIYAMPLEIANRFFEHDKKIFIKYMPHEYSKKSKIKISAGMKFYFYTSKNEQKIIGEAIIRKIEFVDYQDIITKYINQLVITKEELITYTNNRAGKKAMLIKLDNCKKYKKPIKTKKPITMGGHYVTEQNKNELL